MRHLNSIMLFNHIHRSVLLCLVLSTQQAIWIIITSVQVVSPESYPCPNVLYAVSPLMLHGIDITNFNAPLGWFDNLGNNPVLDVSCDANLTWSNALHAPNVSLDIPDQVAQLTLLEQDDLHWPTVLFAHDMLDVRQILLSLSTTSQQSENIPIGACSQNFYYKEHLQNYFRDNQTLALMVAQIRLYSIELKPPGELIVTPDFANAVKALSTVKYEHDPKAYKHFIGVYGTHYIERATFGGMIVKEYQIPHEFLLSTSEGEIEACVRASFFEWIGQKNVYKPKDYEEFNSKIDNNKFAHYKFIGPISEFEFRKGRSQNFDQLYLYPDIVDYTLKPVENLISDVKVRAEVRFASEVYRIGAYLDELKVVYKFAKFYYQPSEQDRVLLNNVEAFVNNSKCSQCAINSTDEAIQVIDELYSKVKDKARVDQLITDSYVTAGLKLQFAQSICALHSSRGNLCPSSAIVAENDQFEQLYREYESSKAEAGKYYTPSMCHQFGRRARELIDRHRMQVDMKQGLGASCQKC